MRNRKHHHFLLSICALLTMAIPAVAMADTPTTAKTKFEINFDHDHFVPLPSQGTNILNVAKSDVLPHLKFSGGIFASWERNPVFLQITDNKDVKTDYPFVGNQVRVDVGVGFGLFDRLDLNLSLPIIAYQSGSKDVVGKDLKGDKLTDTQALGDSDHFGIAGLRFAPKVRILNPKDYHGFGLGLTANVVIPFMASKYNNFMGSDDKFSFTDGLSGGGDIIADYHHKKGFVVALNLGFQYQPARRFYNYISGNTFNAKLGLEVPLGIKWLKFVGSAYLTTPFEFLNGGSYKTFVDGVSKLKDKKGNPLSKNNTVAEWAAGLQANYQNMVFTLGGGTGFPTLEAVGTPAPRIFLGVGYTPLAKDTDGDGLYDDVDKCPDDPGPKENQGCPWGDRDNDGVRDDNDKCPDQPGPQENQGCPWGDRDKDGILDNIDQCPDQPGPESNNGCPVKDRDGDGLYDDVDKCPDQPGPKENQGCPWGDRDKDGVKDNVDKCPDTAGPKENNGCPWGDKDNDGIPDNIDKCPDQPETYNGYKDDDGCPDKGKSKVVVTDTKIEILEKVFFANNKSIIRKRSYGLLNQVASVLKNYQRITQVRVEGYTDSRGKAAYNLKLSQDRADAVRQYLIDHGISPSRLIAKGYGEEDPIATNDTAKGREKNRRVEFTITEINGKHVDTDSITVKHKEVETSEF